MAAFHFNWRCSPGACTKKVFWLPGLWRCALCHCFLKVMIFSSVIFTYSSLAHRSYFTFSTVSVQSCWLLVVRDKKTNIWAKTEKIKGCCLLCLQPLYSLFSLSRSDILSNMCCVLLEQIGWEKQRWFHQSCIRCEAVNAVNSPRRLYCSSWVVSERCYDWRHRAAHRPTTVCWLLDFVNVKGAGSVCV